VTISPVGRTAGNALQPPTEVHRFHLADGSGASVELIDLGAGVDLVRLPDRSGAPAEVCLTLDSLADREDPKRNPHLGVTVGRYANRIAGAHLELDGRSFALDANEGPNQLHGGSVGFGHVVWEHELLDDGVRFRRTSPAGEMGFPGTLEVSVTYRLARGVLRIDFDATTDEPTVVSLTNHTYWNLGGPSEPDVRDHVATVPAGSFVEVDGARLPSGPALGVDDGPFDLRPSARLGDRIGRTLPEGYDHCFLPDGAGFRRHARMEHPGSGRWLEAWSNMPGVQLYTGGFLDGSARGRGRRHDRFAALCLEPEHLPDAPNQPWAPSPVLRPGERYRHRLEFRFGAD
jgi:aldose 1-epimerase